MRSLEVRVLVDLCGAQRVSSVDSGGGRGADVGLMCELRLVLAVVKRGRGQHPMVHGHGDLVDDAGGVRAVLVDRVPRSALGRHQMGHSSGGAQSGRACVGVQVRLTGQVRGRQVRVDVPRVTGTVVVK